MPIVNIESWPLEKEMKPVIIKKITKTALFPNLKDGVFNHAVFGIENYALKWGVLDPAQFSITEVFTELGIPAQAVTVVIHETEMENWGSAGEQHSVKFKDLKR